MRRLHHCGAAHLKGAQLKIIRGGDWCSLSIYHFWQSSQVTYEARDLTSAIRRSRVDNSPLRGFMIPLHALWPTASSDVSVAKGITIPPSPRLRFAIFVLWPNFKDDLCSGLSVSQFLKCVRFAPVLNPMHGFPLNEQHPTERVHYFESAL